MRGSGRGSGRGTEQGSDAPSGGAPQGAGGGPAGSGGVDDLLDRARAALLGSYAPYSGVAVGAALRTVGGQVFTGSNVENASYGLTICAERSAAVAAISAGHREFEAIAIATDREQPLMPCGACRQFLQEFAPDLRVVVTGAAGASVEATLADLLPRAFGPSDLS